MYMHPECTLAQGSYITKELLVCLYMWIIACTHRLQHYKTIPPAVTMTTKYVHVYYIIHVSHTDLL